MQAVIFDFDGLVYGLNANWRIIDSHAGVIGSYVNCLDACKTYDNIMKSDRSKKITEFFSVEDLYYQKHPITSECNLLPYQNIINAARIHQQKGRELFIFSSKNYEGFDAMMDRIYFEHQQRIGQSQPLLKSNPFRTAKYVYPSTPVESSSVSEKDGIFLKMEIIKNMLHYNDEKSEPVRRIRSDLIDDRKFDRLFIYHTQKELINILNQFLAQNKDILSGGVNSIIHYFVADAV
jgi:hypothetical protein